MISDPRLQQISSLIQSGDTASARPLLSEVMKERPNDPEAWYLAAYITDDKEKRLQALEKVIALDPTHEKAQKALAVMKDSNPLNDFLEAPSSSAKPAPQYAQAPQQPVVYVNVQNAPVVNATAIAGTGAAVLQTNGVAFWVGFLVALFTGIYGVAHLINGKIGGAVMSFLLFSVVWPIVIVGTTAVSAGICLIGVLPLHIYFAYTQAKKGATIGA